MFCRILAAGTIVLVLTGAARAQSSSHPVVVEGHGGYAEFIDESPIRHAVIGAAGRVYVVPRVAVGPEVTWMRGPDLGRYWFITGNGWIDLRRSSAGGVTPYLVAGMGLLRHRSLVGTGVYVNRERTFTAGVGARGHIGERWFIAPEFRVGGDGHWRLNAAVGHVW